MGRSLAIGYGSTLLDTVPANCDHSARSATVVASQTRFLRVAAPNPDSSGGSRGVTDCWIEMSFASSSHGRLFPRDTLDSRLLLDSASLTELHQGTTCAKCESL